MSFWSRSLIDTTALKPEEKASYLSILSAVVPLLSEASFAHADLEACVRAEAERRNEKLGPLAKALRYGVTGGKISPGLFEMLEVQGKERVLRRMTKAIEALSS